MVIMMRNMMWQVDFDRLNIEKVRNNQKPNRVSENKSDFENSQIDIENKLKDFMIQILYKKIEDYNR